MERGKSSVTHLSSDQDKSLWVLDELITFKATAEDTDGAYTLFEDVTQPQGGPPPHVQHQDNEGFYVLEGEFEFLYNDRTIKATTGYFVYVPMGVLHTFKNVGTTPGKLLVTASPAGPHEKFFEEVGEAATDRNSPPVPEGPPDIERLVAIAAKYGIEIPPPPEQ